MRANTSFTGATNGDFTWRVGTRFVRCVLVAIPVG